ncbi:hypothetical protein [Streptomyces sp. NPDC051738]|uniref:hypothetical protein n=1 Tax=Streptomyces sp. NPDC051738 TaxID=3365672 RepID=UPI0037D81B65
MALAVWGLADDTDTVELVMSELTANAVHHAHGPKIRLVVNRPAAARVYLAVTDRTPPTGSLGWAPRTPMPTTDADSCSSTPSPTAGATTSSAPPASGPPNACGPS